MAPGSALQTLRQFIHIPLFRCQRLGFNSLQFHSSIEKVLMESGVCPVKRWGLFNCPQTSLYLLCKNYYGVTIFKAYFSIHKKRHLFSVKWIVSPLLSLNPQCLLESFFFSPNSSPHLLLDTLVLSCSGPFICTLEFFSCKFVQWKILFSLDRKHEELKR
ncbi:hypothetical protein mRhiFer1_009441 [Rhinolophus ferrumequinum]|uniref:Uncharacterized protein n=1 Tax=Rhinolophus ferrumequinum TaxID=59479 RepID=A0A7J7RJ88_RHIFE|nr:hypothetical protein mRhiFer1_009441 [Rhinolophus ferrumequinum]